MLLSDYGFKHSDGFVGPCIRDPDVVALDDPCLTDNVLSYMKSTGYRKIPGDICENGVEDTFKKQSFSCCESALSTKNPSTQFPTTHESGVTDEASGPLSQKYVVTVSALAALLCLAVLLALVLGVLAGVFAM